MTGFFDEPRPSGTNRAAPPSDCETCGGDKLVPVEDAAGWDIYRRCPDCNPDLTQQRGPVQGARWQDYDR